jgi:hypothetical protein
MNIRRVTGIAAILIGVVVFSMGLYARGRVADVKKNIHKSEGLFSGNAVTKTFNEALSAQVSAYDRPILWALIGGVTLVVVGVGTLVSTRRR